jgi:membrane protein YqaA with SNARE-associated domain
MKILRQMYDGFGAYAHTPYAAPLLAFLFFVESIFFVPVDPILLVFCLQHRQRAFYYATIATMASVLGGIAAYFIGYAVWASVGQWLAGLLFSPAQFQQAVDYYRQYQVWAVLIAGFTPIPYKLITLTAGFCNLPLLPFIICSCIARGARFYLLASVVWLWGNHISAYIDRFFNILVLLFTLLIVAVFWLLR